MSRPHCECRLSACRTVGKRRIETFRLQCISAWHFLDKFYHFVFHFHCLSHFAISSGKGGGQFSLATGRKSSHPSLRSSWCNLRHTSEYILFASEIISLVTGQVKVPRDRSLRSSLVMWFSRTERIRGRSESACRRLTNSGASNK